jgi:hypothetical protein
VFGAGAAGDSSDRRADFADIVEERGMFDLRCRVHRETHIERRQTADR